MNGFPSIPAVIRESWTPDLRGSKYVYMLRMCMRHLLHYVKPFFKQRIKIVYRIPVKRARRNPMSGEDERRERNLGVYI